MLPPPKRSWTILLCLLFCLHLVAASPPPNHIRRQDSAPAPTPVPEGSDPREPEPSPSPSNSESSVANLDASSTASNSVTASPTDSGSEPTSTVDIFNITIPEGQLPIEPIITPGWGVSGVLLMISGAAHALVGIRKPFFHTLLSTAFLTSLATTVLIVYVMPVPVSNAIQGAYVVAVVLTGVVLGGAATVFREMTEGLGCLLGGFCLSMWLLTLKSGGLFTATSSKVIFIGCLSVGFTGFYFSRYTRDYALLVSIAFSGATVTVLGIDCFSRAGLKEFWAYVWALNDQLFPLGTVTYPVTKGIRVETAGIIILCIVGIVSQLKLWKVVQKKREEREARSAEDQRRLQEEEEAIGRQVEEQNTRDRVEWERTYGNGDSATLRSAESVVSELETEKRRPEKKLVDHDLPPSPSGTVAEMAESSMVGPEAPPPPPKPPVNGIEQKDGVVMIRVVRDDGPERPETPSITDPDEKAWIQSANGDVRSVLHQSRAPVSQDLGPISPPPGVVALPFEVAEGDENHHLETRTVGDRSSVATFADDEDGDNRNKRHSPAKRLSQHSARLLRSLSQKAKNEVLGRRGNSREDLVAISRAPRRDDDDNGSIAATIDGESLDDDHSSMIHDRAERRSIEIKAFLGGNNNQEVKVEGSLAAPADTAAATVPAPTTVQGEKEDDARGEQALEQNPTNKDVEGLDGAVHEKPPAEIQDEPSKANSSVHTTPEPTTLKRELLPEGLSRTAMKYRTNEWVKHATAADAPIPEPLSFAEYSSEEEVDRGEYIQEAPAPLNVEELQQTAENGAPQPTRSVPAMPTRVDSRLSAIAKQKQKPLPISSPSHESSPGASRSASVTGMYRSSSAVNIASPVSGDSGRESRMSQSPTPFEGESSADVSVASASPANTNYPIRQSYANPQLLIAQREAYLAGKAQGTVPYIHPSTSTLFSQPDMYGAGGGYRTASDAGSMYNGYSPHGAGPFFGASAGIMSPGIVGDDDDDMPLSQRRAIIRQSSQTGIPGSVLGMRSPSGAGLYPGGAADGTVFDSHQPQRFSTVPPAAVRDAKLAQFRQSVAVDLRAGMPVMPSSGRETPSGFASGAYGGWSSGAATTTSGREHDVKRNIELQRSILLSQKEAEAQRREMERFEKERNERAFEERMRQGDFMEAHREAMRRLQGGVKGA